MPQKTRAQVQAAIYGIKSLITADGKIDAAELDSVLTDIIDSAHIKNSDTYPSGSGGGTISTTDLAIVPWVVARNKALLAFGNSITQNDEYVRAMSDYFRSSSRTSWTNAGESTRGQIKRINQEDRIPLNRTSIISWMNGINDIRFNNSTTNYKFRHVDHVREFLCNAFAASITTSASPSSTTGTWTNWGNGLTYNGRTNGRYTTDLNGSMTFNFPAGVKSMFVTFFTNMPSDSEDYSSQVDVHCEGVFIESININKKSTSFDHYTYHLPRTYFEASGGGGITLTNKDSGKKMIIDYFGYLADPKDTQPAIVWDNSYVANELMVAGYSEGGNTVPSGINRAWWDECDGAVRQMIIDNFTYYGYPVIMPRTNTFFEPNDFTYTPGGGLTNPSQWDGLHPNLTGHKRIFSALRLCSIVNN